MCTNLLHNLSFLDIYCVSRYNRVKLKFPNCHMILRNIKSLRKSNFKGWILNSVGKLPQLSISSPNKNSLKKRCIPFSGKLIPEIVTNVLSFSLTTKWLLEHWVFKTGLSSTSLSHIRRKTKQNKTQYLGLFPVDFGWLIMESNLQADYSYPILFLISMIYEHFYRT